MSAKGGLRYKKKSLAPAHHALPRSRDRDWHRLISVRRLCFIFPAALLCPVHNRSFTIYFATNNRLQLLIVYFLTGIGFARTRPANGARSFSLIEIADSLMEEQREKEFFVTVFGFPAPQTFSPLSFVVCLPFGTPHGLTLPRAFGPSFSARARIMRNTRERYKIESNFIRIFIYLSAFGHWVDYRSRGKGFWEKKGKKGGTFGAGFCTDGISVCRGSGALEVQSWI